MPIGRRHGATRHRRALTESESESVPGLVFEGDGDEEPPYRVHHSPATARRARCRAAVEA